MKKNSLEPYKGSILFHAYFTVYIMRRVIDMKLTDKLMEMIISGIVKKGIIMENRNVNVNLDIPSDDKSIKVNIKADNVSVKVSE